MQDRYSKYPGRVKLTPVTGQDGLFDMTMADGATQEGTPPTKANLLKDTTAAKYFASGDHTVDDVFLELSRLHYGIGNDYVWERYISRVDPVLGGPTSVIVYRNDSNLYGGTSVQYSDSIKVDGTLSSPGSLYVSYDSYSGLSILKGKYWTSDQVGRDKVYYTSPSSSDAYQQLIGNGFRISAIGQLVISAEEVKQDFSYVNSKSASAYPPAQSDGYKYIALGQLGNKAQIASGTYSGTGTSGSSSPNSLVFPFLPKIVVIHSKYLDTNFVGGFPWIIGNRYGRTIIDSSSNHIFATLSMDENTLSWYASDSINQLNRSSEPYSWVAIG